MPLRKAKYDRDEDGYWHPEGEVMKVMGLNRGTLSVLERVEEKPEPDYPTDDEGEPLCVGKEDGQCGNTVDEPGDTCWHHSDD